jgi:hypothetical protein
MPITEATGDDINGASRRRSSAMLSHVARRLAVRLIRQVTEKRFLTAQHLNAVALAPDRLP